MDEENNTFLCAYIQLVLQDILPKIIMYNDFEKKIVEILKINLTDWASLNFHSLITFTTWP